LETAVYQFMIDSAGRGERVPGHRKIMKHLGCSDVAARSAMSGLVRKGWLGESGDYHRHLYFNDKPEDID
jgi:DNA-binding transcriptional regulator PaaX